MVQFLSFIMGFGLYGSTFIIPLYTQSTLGWTAQQAGMLMIPSAITTAFMMPMIGNILQKGVPQKLLVAAGMILFSGFTYWCYTILTPDTDTSNFFWPLILRGMGMGMLFIPITALSLSSLKGQQIGQGAAFTGMMRQLGGSFGIALITTFMSRQNMVHRNALVSHLDSNNYYVLATKSTGHCSIYFINKGMSADASIKKRLCRIRRHGDETGNCIILYGCVFISLYYVLDLCAVYTNGKKQKSKRENRSIRSNALE